VKRQQAARRLPQCRCPLPHSWQPAWYRAALRRPHAIGGGAVSHVTVALDTSSHLAIILGIARGGDEEGAGLHNRRRRRGEQEVARDRNIEPDLPLLFRVEMFNIVARMLYLFPIPRSMDSALISSGHACTTDSYVNKLAHARACVE
jgi:hypothetical protein